jgi:hypothetical protein
VERVIADSFCETAGGLFKVEMLAVAVSLSRFRKPCYRLRRQAYERPLIKPLDNARRWYDFVISVVPNAHNRGPQFVIDGAAERLFIMPVGFGTTWTFRLGVSSHLRR